MSVSNGKKPIIEMINSPNNGNVSVPVWEHDTQTLTTPSTSRKEQDEILLNH